MARPASIALGSSALRRSDPPWPKGRLCRKFKCRKRFKAGRGRLKKREGVARRNRAPRPGDTDRRSGVSVVPLDVAIEDGVGKGKSGAGRGHLHKNPQGGPRYSLRLLRFLWLQLASQGSRETPTFSCSPNCAKPPGGPAQMAMPETPMSGIPPKSLRLLFWKPSRRRLFRSGSKGFFSTYNRPGVDFSRGTALRLRSGQACCALGFRGISRYAAEPQCRRTTAPPNHSASEPPCL